MKYPIVKGTFDILPQEIKKEDLWKESHRWTYVEQILREAAMEYGFREIRTPIFERTELFERSVGESSDIISKEMYTFLDRKGRSLSLRPEGTASVVRAFISNHLYTTPGIHKFFYIGSMFRYERPQAGRYRQLHQFGVEAIGSIHPYQDVELIDLMHQIYQRLGLKDLCISINSVGDVSSRTAYRTALLEYLTPYKDQLSADSQIRLEKNVLRILDSKLEQDQKILKNAPLISEYLSKEAKEHFQIVLHELDQLKIPYQVEPKLVRGLDYYSNTVFEITSGQLGAQNAVGAGGRYDGLVADLGGPDLPATGFAIGIERLLQTMLKQEAAFPSPPKPDLFLIPMNAQAAQLAFKLITQLRHKNIAAQMDLTAKKIQYGLQLANLAQATAIAVIGDDEIASGTITCKKLATRESHTFSIQHLIDNLKGWLNV
ncbi:MAG: histidine--tRNA ligase [Candidatus Rhabdochlamydia sp.]